MSLQNQYRVHLTLDGEDYGVFDKKEGGEVDSEESKYRPGGMAPQISLGGQTEVGNLTLSRLYERDRDHARVHALMGRVGKGSVVVTVQPLDEDANPWEDPLVYNGTLKRVQPPDVDSMSSDPAMLEIEITPAGTVS